MNISVAPIRRDIADVVQVTLVVNISWPPFRTQTAVVVQFAPQEHFP